MELIVEAEEPSLKEEEAAKQEKPASYGKDTADKNIVNIMRRIILRLRPYMTANSSAEMAYKSLQIY